MSNADTTPVPIKSLKNAAMLVPMRVADALRTKWASASRVRRFIPHALSLLRFLSTHPRNSVAPNSFTSYFVLRTSYLVTPVSPCLKAIAHHEARIFLGTAVCRYLSPHLVACPENLRIHFQKLFIVE